MTDLEESVASLKKEVGELRVQLRELRGRIGFARIRYDYELEEPVSNDWDIEEEVTRIEETLENVLSLISDALGSDVSRLEIERIQYASINDALKRFRDIFPDIANKLASLDDVAEARAIQDIRNMLVNHTIEKSKSTIVGFITVFMRSLTNETLYHAKYRSLRRAAIGRLRGNFEEERDLKLALSQVFGTRTMVLNNLNRKSILCILFTSLKLIEEALS